MAIDKLLDSNDIDRIRLISPEASSPFTKNFQVYGAAVSDEKRKELYKLIDESNSPSLKSVSSESHDEHIDIRKLQPLQLTRKLYSESKESNTSVKTPYKRKKRNQILSLSKSKSKSRTVSLSRSSDSIGSASSSPKENKAKEN